MTWFPTVSPSSTTFQSVEDGGVPLLMPIVRMMSLKCYLECTPQGVMLRSLAVDGGERVELEFLSAGHVAVDLAAVA